MSVSRGAEALGQLSYHQAVGLTHELRGIARALEAVPDDVGYELIPLVRRGGELLHPGAAPYEVGLAVPFSEDVADLMRVQRRALSSADRALAGVEGQVQAWAGTRVQLDDVRHARLGLANYRRRWMPLAEAGASFAPLVTIDPRSGFRAGHTMAMHSLSSVGSTPDPAELAASLQRLDGMDVHTAMTIDMEPIVTKIREAAMEFVSRRPGASTGGLGEWQVRARATIR